MQGQEHQALPLRPRQPRQGHEQPRCLAAQSAQSRAPQGKGTAGHVPVMVLAPWAGNGRGGRSQQSSRPGARRGHCGIAPRPPGEPTSVMRRLAFVRSCGGVQRLAVGGACGGEARWRGSVCCSSSCFCSCLFIPLRYRSTGLAAVGVAPWHTAFDLKAAKHGALPLALHAFALR